MNNVNNKVSASMYDLLARVDLPTVESPGLPARAYCDDAFFRLERQRLFAHHWFALGLARDVPEPGDIRPVSSAAGRPLLMVRGEDGALRVFHNYCRHRGMRLVDEATTGWQHIVCPYHAWCYDLSGALVRRPHYRGYGVHEHHPEQGPGLEPVRCAVWNQIVFVNLGPTAPGFEQVIGPLERRWAHYDFRRLVHGASLSFEVAANWKLAVENFIDIYHIPYVHPGLNRYLPMQEHYFVKEGEHVVGEGSAAYAPRDAGAGRLPEFPDLDDEQAATIEALSVFPNLLITVFSDNLRVILVEPTGPESCRERVEIFFAGEAALDPALAAERDAVVGRFPVFNREDVDIVERLQQNFASAAFERAHFSEFFDGNVHHFQRMVAHACAA